MSDPVKAPAHYRGDGVTTCKVAMKSMMSPADRRIFDISPDAFYWWGCAFKYLWRWPFKENSVRDLEKCAECIEELLREVE